jgi:hypothetical protein
MWSFGEQVVVGRWSDDGLETTMKPGMGVCQFFGDLFWVDQAAQAVGKLIL